METAQPTFCEEAIDVHARCLILETDESFRANGDQLRRCVTAIRPDDAVLHHHVSGSGRFRAPPVRYVVTGGVARLVGVREGLEALERLYAITPMVLWDRSGRKPVEGRELWDVHARIGVSSQFRVYRSLSPWLALNQENHRRYRADRRRRARDALLEEVFVGNVLSMLGSFELHVETRVKARILQCRERPIRHKEIDMLGFLVTVETNAILHPWLGLGKLVSKGYGLFYPNDDRAGRTRDSGKPWNGEGFHP